MRYPSRILELIIVSAMLLFLTSTSSLAGTITWTGNGGNNSWHTPGNWDLTRVPEAGDAVVIPDLAGTASISYSTGTTSIQSLQCAEVLNLSGGTLDLAGALTSTNSLSLSGGTLTGAGDFAISGAFDWTGGTMAGSGTTTIPVGMNWSVEGSNQPSLRRTLLNDGNCSWTSANSIDIASGGIFRNRSGATFSARNDQALSGVGSFENQAGATFVKTASNGTTGINCTFVNQSLIDLQSGALNINMNSTFTNQGTIQTAPGTNLTYLTGTFNHAAGSTLATQGGLQFSATVNFDPGAIFHPGGAVSITSGTTTIPFDVTFPSLSLSATLTGAGNFTVTNSFTWTGGTMAGSGTTTIPVGMNWSVEGSNQPSLRRTLLNDGNCSWTSANSIDIASGGIFRNRSGATFSARNDQALSGVGSFENQAGATFVKTASNGTTGINCTIVNQSLIDLQSGALNINMNSTFTNQGTIQTAPGTNLIYLAGTFNHAAGSTLTTQGGLQFSATVNFDPGAIFNPDGAVSITSGTTTIPFDVTFPSLSLSATLTGGGNFTVTNSFTWTGGTMAGSGTTTIPVGMNWSVEGFNQASLRRTLLNDGNCSWTSANSIDIASGGIFRNRSGATFSARNDQALSGVGSFENQAGATFVKTASNGTTGINCTFVNQSLIDLQSGALNINMNSTFTNQGTIQTAPGTNLIYLAGTFNHAAGSTLATQGSLQFSATVNFDPGAIFHPGGAVSITSGTTTIPFDVTFPSLSLSATLTGAGNFTVTNSFTWTGGTMAGSGTTTIPVGMNWSVEGSNQPSLRRTLLNDGNCSWTSANSIDIASGGIFRNRSGATFSARNDQALSGVGSFENQAGATFVKTASNGTTGINCTFVNQSLIDLQSGALNINMNSTFTNQGTIQTAPGTNLTYLTGTFNHAAGSTLATQGSLQINATVNFDPGAIFHPGGAVSITSGTTTIPFDVTFSSLSLSATLTGAGNFTVTNSFTWTGGTMSGTGTTTILPGVNWSVEGINQPSLRRTLLNDGNCSWTSGNSIDIASGGIFRNRSGARFSAKSNQTISGSGLFENQAGAVFETTAQNTGGTTQIQGILFNNQGTVDLESGNLTITGSGFQNFSSGVLTGGTYILLWRFRFPDADIATNAATIVLDGGQSGIEGLGGLNGLRNFATNTAAGSITIRNGRGLEVPAFSNAGEVHIGPGNENFVAASYVQSSGDTRLIDGGKLQSSGITIDGGSLSGSGQVFGNVANNGLVTPGASPGAITVFGNYTQGSNGKLRVEIGGTNQGTDYDFLNVDGTASLAGTLEPSLIGGFVPSEDTTFDIVTGHPVIGTFTDDNLPLGYPGGCLAANYTPDQAQVVSHAGAGFTQQPQDQIVCAGDAATFTVGTSGAPPVQIQWRKNGNDIQGANGPSLTIDPVQTTDAGTYDAVISNICGDLASDPATLTVHAAPVISGQPQAQEVCLGQPATFSVTASGAPAPTFQWRKDIQNIDGANQSTLTIGAVGSGDAGTYDVVVQNGCGTLTSDSATLSLKSPTSITGQPQGATVCVGDPFTLTVSATGLNLSFQWRKNLHDIQGANASSLTLDPIQIGDAGSYDVVVAGDCGSVTSDAAGVVVQICTDATGACCFPDGSCNVLTAASCTQAGGTYQGDNTGCDPNPCAQPTGACCFVNGTCQVLNAAACSAQSGTYQGNFTSCDPNPCAQPTGACCFVNGTCQVLNAAACSAQSGTYQGNFTSCDPNPCAQPTGACCFVDGTCQVLTSAACSAQNGTYQGNFTSCDPNPCAQPTGACCFVNGTCQVLNAAACSAQSGTYQGNFTSCDPNPCVQPTGACCFVNGTCQVLNAAACSAQSGTYQGNFTSCDPNPCAQPTGACCFVDGTCQVLNAAACSAQNGTYQGNFTDCDPNPCGPPPPCEVAVTSPNGGEVWTIGSAQTIRWNHGVGCGSSVKIEILRQGPTLSQGHDAFVICSTIAANAPNTGSFGWTVAGCGSGPGRYKIQITDLTSGVSDRSDRPFQIAIPGTESRAMDEPSLFLANPFRPNSVIALSMPVEGPVRVEIFTVSGQRIRTLLDGNLAAGDHEIGWDATSDGGGRVTPGVYYLRVVVGSRQVKAKILLVR